MYISVPTRIHSHLSKPRLLLETNGGINEQYLQWVCSTPIPRVRRRYCDVYT